MTNRLSLIRGILLATTLVFSAPTWLAAQPAPAAYRLRPLVDSTLDVALQHYRTSAASYAVKDGYPASAEVSATSDGQPTRVSSENWVSGFYPGALWYLYEASGDTTLLRAAKEWTAGLYENQYRTNTHDLGFMMSSSYGNGYRLTGQREYRSVLLRSAAMLSARFNPTVGSLKSWDWGGNRWSFPVIVDNLMNLELLTVAARLADEPMYRQQAVQHAETTKSNHFREDYSSYHVVDYDPASGEVLQRMTYQGYADSSMWARGQAWAIYGYTMLFRELGDTTYLEFANQLLTPYLAELPADNVPYWDFDDPDIPNAPRDASAAAVVVSALLELHALDTTNASIHLHWAERMLESLSGQEYLAAPGTNGNFVLKHGTGNKPADREIDAPLIYADYYFIEALLRYRKLATPFSDALHSVTFAEDTGPYVIAEDLLILAGLPAGSQYTTEIKQFSENLQLHVDSTGRLVVNTLANYYGSSSAEIYVTTTDTTIAFAFDIDVLPVNDAPLAFNLLNPASGEDLASGNILFRWDQPAEVDGDPLTFSLHLSGGTIDTTFTNLTEPKLRFVGEGRLEAGTSYSWYVAADDGQLSTYSDTLTFSLESTVSTRPPAPAPGSVVVYPNPANDIVNIVVEAAGPGKANWILRDVHGKTLLTRSFTLRAGSNRISQPLNLPAGFYFYLLSIPGERSASAGRLLINH